MRQNEDGKYIGANGSLHDNASSAAATLKQAIDGNRIQSNFLGGLLQFVPLAIIAGVLVVIGLTLLAGVRGFLVLAQKLPLFGVSAIPIALAIAVFLKFMKGKIISRVLLSLFLGTILGGIVSIPFFWLSYKYYTRTDLHFPTVYSVDFIQALPDGTNPALYEKRFQKGNKLAELTVGEKVTVNGVTVGYGEFNITTANGVTGWIPISALPEDNVDMLSINISVDGFDSEDIAIDRSAVHLYEKYLAVDKTLTVMDKPTDFYKISDTTLRRSISVRTETPLMAVGSKEYKNGAELSDTGARVTLMNVLYSDDCTILYLAVNDKTVRDLSGTFNTTAWKKSLAATDIATGETWKPLQVDYGRTWWYYQIEGGNFVSSIVFFFPPSFKSRHFSLTHEVSPLPPKEKAGYGGLLGLAASMTGGTNAAYLDYNFPEIRVRSTD